MSGTVPTPTPPSVLIKLSALHLRYEAWVLQRRAKTGTGLLKLGIHSRSESTGFYIERRVKAGNCYIYRNQTRVVVGVQPFDGREP